MRLAWIVTAGFAIFVVIVSVVIFSALSVMIGQERLVELRHPDGSLGPSVDLRIGKVDPALGFATGEAHVELETRGWSLPPGTTKLDDARLTVLEAEGGIVARTGAFTLTRIAPVSTRFAGTATLEWDIVGSPSGFLFPFDRYELSFARAYVVAFGESATIREIVLFDIRITDSNLVTISRSGEWPAEGKATTVELVRPWPMMVLFAVYVVFAFFVGSILATQEKASTFYSTLVGLGTIFGARETLTRKVDLYPTLVDVTLILIFVAVGFIVLTRLADSEKPKPPSPH